MAARDTPTGARFHGIPPKTRPECAEREQAGPVQGYICLPGVQLAAFSVGGYCHCHWLRFGFSMLRGAPALPTATGPPTAARPRPPTKQPLVHWATVLVKG